MVKVLAFDFGASSGRAILGCYDPSQSQPFTYQEIHRFENTPITIDGTLCWDFDTLLAQVQIGIQKAGDFDSLGFDTWGVDFGLLDQDGKLIANPVHYRDTRTDGMLDVVADKLPLQRLYAYTGNQIMAINTLFQLVSLQQNKPELLQQADKLLFMPDLFAYHFCGNAVCEDSIASTSQLLNPTDRQWSKPVCDAFSIDPEKFGKQVATGSVIGEYQGAKVIAVAGHDTQSAVAALPTQSKDVAFLSCGTWSLLGTELDSPVLTEQSRQSDLSNELGVGGKVNYLKNIIGLWLVQESRRAWKRAGQSYSFAELDELAQQATPLQSFIDPDAPEFAVPGDIPTLVQEFCRRTGQIVPESVGAIVRCIYESLSLKYHLALQQLGDMTGKKFEALHILGGGTKSTLLCQWTANSIGLPVYAGPIEATALGNMMIQLMALDAVADLDTARQLIADTETIICYQPAAKNAWSKAFVAYKNMMTKEQER